MDARVAPLALLTLLFACGNNSTGVGNDEITTVQATGVELTATSTSSTGNKTTSTSDASSSATSGATVTVDVGSSGWDVPARCNALDLLFVVERTPDVHVKMNAVASELAGQLTDALPGWSIRFLHVSSSLGTIPLICEDPCQETGECDVLGATPCDDVDTCDWTRGAGVVWRNAATRCIEQPRRWVDAEVDDAGEIIDCLWTGGAEHGERDSIGSLLAAVDPALTADDGCNAGFLREDAWLLPVMILHGYPVHPGSPSEWAAMIFDAKGGDAEAVVPVGLLDPEFIVSDPPGCEEGPGDQTGEHHAFFEEFPVAVLGDKCKPFTPQIMEAVAHMAEVCRVGETPE